jgi:hypothetical protein
MPKLKMVWASMNPNDGTDHTEEIGKALEDRFHCYVDVPWNPSAAILALKMPVEIAQALVEWWRNDLSIIEKNQISPRRLEYIGMTFISTGNFQVSLPMNQRFQTQKLRDRLAVAKAKATTFIGFTTTLDLFLRPVEAVAAARNAATATKIADLCRQLLPNQFADRKIINIIKELPAEYRQRVFKNKRGETKKKFNEAVAIIAATDPTYASLKI